MCLDRCATLKSRPYLDLGRSSARSCSIAPHRSTSCASPIGPDRRLRCECRDRSIQRGYLRRIGGEEVNFSMPPCCCRPGVHVEVTKSAAESDYTELIQVQAENPEGRRYSAKARLSARQQAAHHRHQRTGRRSSGRRQADRSQNVDVPGMTDGGTILARRRQYRRDVIEPARAG